ncbi:hypothetical protein FRB99_005961 [Tulasnella sp. 403]|nr:hypothetical protein FRB99_005961 [Tulasnella sp. 403]
MDLLSSQPPDDPSQSSISDQASCTPLPTIPYTTCYCEENIYLLGSSLVEVQSRAGSNGEIFVVVISNATRSVAIWQQAASRMSAEEDYLVVWDYHVILVAKFANNRAPFAIASHGSHQGTMNSAAGEDEVGVEGSPEYHQAGNQGVWVYDFDSRLGVPCPWDRYVQHTFRASTIVAAGPDPQNSPFNPKFRCKFRVIPVADYLANFASDRSHMRMESPADGVEVYRSPPPSYPPIVGQGAKERGETNNLMTQFVDMGVGESSEEGEGDRYGVVFDDWEFLQDTQWMTHLRGTS